MKYDIGEYLSLFLPIDSEKIAMRFKNKKSKPNRIKYNTPEVRKAYLLFANSTIFKEAHYYIYKRIYELFERESDLSVLDLGIGEGLMWQKIIQYFKGRQKKKLRIIGIDYSGSALMELQRNLSELDFITIYPIKGDLSKVDRDRLPFIPDVAVSSLAMHHLRYGDKVKVIKTLSNLGIRHLLLVEVDFNLEKIRDIKLRNISATILYRDVLDTIRVLYKDKDDSEKILNDFYYDEYIRIIKSNYLNLEERYLSISEWADIIASSKMNISQVKCLFTGVNNIYKIGLVEGIKS